MTGDSEPMAALSEEGRPRAVPRPYWWDDIDWPDGLDVALPAAVDVAIVGGGYAGLSAALTLTRAGRSVVVLDAQRPGHGASSRSGGMIGSGHRLSYAALARRYGERQAEAILREGLAALDFTTALIAREQIDCQFSRCGRFRGAWTAAAYEAMAREIETLRRAIGLDADVVDRAQARDEVATDRYHGGCVFHRHGGVHPARFLAGLLERARAAGTVVAGGASVRAIAGRRGAFALATSRGTVAARDVIVATNGYTGQATPRLARRLLAVSAYLMATDPLGAARVRAIIPRQRMIVETRSRHCYYRPSPDGTRLIFGARAALQAITLDAAATRLRRFMVELFPDLAATGVSHVWTGSIAFARDHLTHIGVLDGIHYALACNGSGVAMAPYAGHKAALKVMGTPAGATAFDAHPFKVYPPFMRSQGALAVAETYYRLIDRREGSR